MSLLLPAVSHVSTKNIRVVGQNAENAAVESERALSEKKKILWGGRRSFPGSEIKIWSDGLFWKKAEVCLLKKKYCYVLAQSPPPPQIYSNTIVNQLCWIQGGEQRGANNK